MYQSINHVPEGILEYIARETSIIHGFLSRCKSDFSEANTQEINLALSCWSLQRFRPSAWPLSTPSFTPVPSDFLPSCTLNVDIVEKLFTHSYNWVWQFFWGDQIDWWLLILFITLEQGTLLSEIRKFFPSWVQIVVIFF